MAGPTGQSWQLFWPTLPRRRLLLLVASKVAGILEARVVAQWPCQAPASTPPVLHRANQAAQLGIEALGRLGVAQMTYSGYNHRLRSGDLGMKILSHGLSGQGERRTPKPHQ